MSTHGYSPKKKGGFALVFPGNKLGWVLVVSILFHSILYWFVRHDRAPQSTTTFSFFSFGSYLVDLLSIGRSVLKRLASIVRSVFRQSSGAINTFSLSRFHRLQRERAAVQSLALGGPDPLDTPISRLRANGRCLDLMAGCGRLGCRLDLMDRFKPDSKNWETGPHPSSHLHPVRWIAYCHVPFSLSFLCLVRRRPGKPDRMLDTLPGY